jgi:hypothetical protein
MTAFDDEAPLDCGCFAYTLPLERPDAEAERSLVVVLSDPDDRDTVEVALVS